ncbi:MAG: CTP synthase [Endomicrobium sp.]|jgi:CTP synthase|nr:CTP synthase [Endomicrobium sp.]
MKYIFITGGVVSSLGKGISGASIGKLLQLHGLTVNIIKFDPYINIDPGTMNPYQHGEIFVTEDGSEADLDLGTYERFLNIYTTKANTNTAGDIYKTVINKERQGCYNGATVQVIPHVTNEIKKRFVSFKDKYDIYIIEIGGTVGDIESLPFLEAVRQFRLEKSPHDVFHIHVTLIPYIKSAEELKTKPTQHSVNKLREIGIIPDMIICRTEHQLNKLLRRKISLFCNVHENAVIEALDIASIYLLPEKFYLQKVDLLLINQLHIKPKKKFTTTWFNQINNSNILHKPKFKIAIVGKYAGCKDAYKSIDESLHIAAMSLQIDINILYCNADEDNKLIDTLIYCDGIIVPGGFGYRGLNGKLKAITFARKNNIPFLGICLGMQCSIIEISRNVANLYEANSTEFDKNTKYPVVKILDDQKNITYRGGTMRLGSYKAIIKKHTLAYSLYNTGTIIERHRHRYEMNPAFINLLEKKGLIVSAYHNNILPEIIEMTNHKFFIGVQFHPEFASRITQAHPIFIGLLNSILNTKGK